MLRVATILVLVAAAATLATLVNSGTARGAGCEVLALAADRAECVARARAREAARAQVQRARDGRATGIPATPAQGRGAAWQRSVEESDGIDPRELLDARLLAALGGLAWFGWSLRSRRVRTRSSS